MLWGKLCMGTAMSANETEQPAVQKRTLHDLEKVRSFLSELRETGQDQLPPERDLVDQLGLTRSRLRGALKKLANEGLIWREVGNGTYFGQRPLTAMGASRAAELSRLTNPLEVMEARLLLEPELARLAAFRARHQDIAEMELCIKRMRESSNRGDWTYWDQRFHYTIGRASDNTLLLVLYETVQQNMGRGTWGELADKMHQRSSTEGSMHDHEAIIAPIRSRNPDAAYRAMLAHLRRVKDIYFGEDRDSAIQQP
jgi:DNA-binding FadR family transcriptional regulator